jgi:hypothetical protein
MGALNGLLQKAGLNLERLTLSPSVTDNSAPRIQNLIVAKQNDKGETWFAAVNKDEAKK